MLMSPDSFVFTMGQAMSDKYSYTMILIRILLLHDIYITGSTSQVENPEGSNLFCWWEVIRHSHVTSTHANLCKHSLRDVIRTVLEEEAGYEKQLKSLKGES